MKKIVLIILLLLSLTGCVNITNSDIKTIINEAQNSDLELVNKYRTGFKYYLPTNMNVVKTSKANEVVSDGEYDYYLYVDLISFYNNVKFNYKTNDTSYLSLNISNNEKDGYLEINKRNDKYLIEIMYNYAKIEVIVEEEYIKNAISNSIVILSTIDFNSDIISSMLDEDILNFSEEELNIFETNIEEGKFLDIVEEFDTYEGEDVVPDYDLVN